MAGSISAMGGLSVRAWDRSPPLEAAYTFFTLTSGPFRFHEDVLLDKPTITQSNNMIIMEGIMRQEALAHAPEPALSSTTILRLVPNPAPTGGEISLEADEWRVLTMVNRKKHGWVYCTTQRPG